MTPALALSRLLGGTLKSQAARLGVSRSQWSRYVAGASTPLASAIDGWIAALAKEGITLSLTVGPGGWSVTSQRYEWPCVRTEART